MELTLANAGRATAPDPLEVFGEHPWDAAQRAQDEAQAKWWSENRQRADEAFLDPQKAFPDMEQGFADSVDTQRMLAANDDLLRLYRDGEDPPADDYGRYLDRLKIAHHEFNGEGAESEEEFFAAAQKHAQKRVDEREFSKKLAAAVADDVSMPIGEGKGLAGFLKEAAGKPGYDAEKTADYAEAWNEARTLLAEKMAPYKDTLNQTWLAFTNKTFLPREEIAAVPDEAWPEFLQALRLRAETLPDEEKETFLAGMRKDLDRSLETFGRNAGEAFIGHALDMAGDPMADMAGDGIASFNAEQWEAREATKADFERQRNRAHEVRRILNAEYDPIDYVKGWGWAQKLPGVTATSLTMAVPVIGMGTMGMSMLGAAQEKAYLNARASGMSEMAAGTYSNAIAPAVAIPQAILEKVGFGIWANKLPAVKSVLTKMDDAIMNRGLRFLTKTAAISAAETGIEITQDLTETVITDIASALNSDLPDVDWRTELKGAWNSIPEIAGSMILLSMFGAAGGLNTEARASAFQQASDRQLTAAGLTPDAIRNIRNAQGPASTVAAVEAAWSTRDPNSPEAKAASEEEAAAMARARAAGEALRSSGAIPSIVVGKDGFTVLDGETKEEVGSAKTMGDAWRIAQAHSDFLADLQGDAVGYMATLLESAEFVAKLDPDTKTELDLGTVMDRALLEATKPEMAARFALQVAMKEQAAGGTGEISYSINGWSETEIRDNLRQTTNRIFQGGNVLTVFHEFTHGKRREARAAGRITRADELSFIRAIDTVLGTRQTKEGERMAFLENGLTDDQVTEEMIDEAMSEIMEMEILRSREGGTKRKLPQRPGVVGVPSGFITRNLKAIGRLAPEATRKFTAFIEAVRSHFGTAMARALALKKAEREGKFDSDSYDAFLAKMMGLDLQDDHNARVDEEAARIYTGDPRLSPEAFAGMDLSYDPAADDIPFSIGRATVRVSNDTRAFQGAEGSPSVIGPAAFSIRAWHGTPHKVDKFTTKKIGTGEGAQAYGWGLYFAEQQSIALQYKEKLSGNARQLIDGQGRKLGIPNLKDDYLPEHWAEMMFYRADGDYTKAREDLAKWAERHEDLTANPDKVTAASQVLDDWEKSGVKLIPPGNLYRVTLKVDDEDLLDWDKPLSEQSEKVKAALGRMGFEVKEIKIPDEPDARWGQIGVDTAGKTFTYDQAASSIYLSLKSGNPQEASDALAAAGIRGIRYLDGNSRGAGEGSYNYVIFDENDIEIVEENGQPVDLGAGGFSLAPGNRTGLISGIDTNPPGGANIGDAALPDSALHQSIKAVIPPQKVGEFSIAIVDGWTVKQHAFRHGDGWVAVVPDSSFRHSKDRVYNQLFRLFQEEIGKERLGENIYIRVTNKKEDYEHLKAGTHHGSQNHGLNDFDTETDPNEGGLSVSRHFEFPAKYAYLVTGERATTGTDGEPVLDISTAKPVSKLMKFDTLQEKLGAFEDAPGGMPRMQYFFSNTVKSTPFYQGIHTNADFNVHPFNQSPPADSGAFSLAPSRALDLMQMNALDRVRNPRRRAEIFTRMSREFQRLKLAAERLELLTGTGTKRIKKSLVKDAAMREALAREDFEKDVYARFWQVFADEDLVKIKSQPVHAHLSVFRPAHKQTRKKADGSTYEVDIPAGPDPLRGRLMSRAAAMKTRPELFGDNYKGGEWDGADNIARSVFGGELMPDQAAQELYEAGLIKDPHVDTMWQALEAEQNSVAGMKEQLAKAQEQLRAGRLAAKEEANAWLRSTTELYQEHYNPREEILRMVASLEAILRPLPAPVRVKVGGYQQMIRIAGTEGQLKFLREQISKADRELEKWMRETIGKEFRELLAKTKPERDEAGKRPKGKIGADIHDIFRSIENAMFLDGAETEAEATRLETLAEAETTTEEQRAHLMMEANLVRLTGNWAKADSARREAALEAATNAYFGGYMQAQMKAAGRRARNEFRRADLKAATGKAGERMERVAAEVEGLGTKMGRAKQAVFSLFSFDQMLGLVFGEDSETRKLFGDWELRCANSKEDNTQRAHDSVESLLTDLAGGELAGEKLRHKLATERSVKWIDFKGREQTATEQEVISYTLWWRQEDGKRHMEGLIEEKPDGTTEVLSDWHWREEDINAIEAQLSKEAKAIRMFLTDSYAAEYDRINAVFSDLYGINMPRHKDYSPIKVAPSHAAGGQTADPVSGTMQGPGLTPGSLKNRSHSAVAEPARIDALQHFVAHTKQMEHFIAYAAFSNELMAVVNNREVGNTIEAKAGKEAVNVIRGWADYFAQGGTRDAAAHLAASHWFQRGLDRISQMALVGRASVLAIQSVQLGAALYQMPAGSYLKRLAKLTTGQLGWGKAIRSDYIQRRLSQMPPAVQQAMAGLAAGSPSRIKHATAKLGRLISGADALFTAGTYAIIYDYQLTAAKRMGIPNPEAFAEQETIRLTDQVAQPMRAGARSMMEVTSTNPAFRMMWAFASEPRQKIAMAVHQAMTKKGAGRFRAAGVTWLVSGMVAAILRSAIRDIRDDGEDDEVFDETNWSPERLILASLAGPLGGFPLIGKEIESALYAGAGEYMPGGSLIGGPVKAVGTVRKLATGKGEWEDAIKDTETILGGVGAAFPTAAAGTSWLHIARDVEGIIKNTTED